MPFEFVYKRDEHFDKHCIRRGEFPCRTGVEYEARAEAFMTSRRRITTLQCRRPQGDTIRYDLFTNEMCVLGMNGFIITYFVVSKRYHNKRFNTCYFCTECKRIF